MSNYFYDAVDAGGLRSQGSLDVIDQNAALRRIKEMGLFPLRVREAALRSPGLRSRARRASRSWLRMPEGRVKAMELAVFTRQLATLVDVGMPLLRGLKLLEEQEENRTLKRVIGDLSRTIESGGTLSEAMASYPRVFNPLYVNMVKAGEIGGVLETVLQRQAEFLETAQRIRGRVKAAMFYPAAVMATAAGIILLLMVFIIPRFESIFDGLLNGRPLPGFTVAVLRISDVFKEHFLALGAVVAGGVVLLRLLIATRRGRRWFDRMKLAMPVVGRICRRVALGRFARTLGTLLGSGVPILQALTIVRETTGNVIVGDVVARIHRNVKEGGSVTEPLKDSRIFPAMISGMVDVGEQTGALPDMLAKIADTADEQVDNAVTAMTSLLEPVMIIFLAVIVGSIVFAMFYPIIIIVSEPGFGGGGD
ncbi:MAG TPA: type II secretion system F family protein [Verrucomicrobiae bacterium]|nr:type II secretion system F family protein [Verrucomicrobiae bacterium]